ncbi:MAG: hypothetical protein ACRDL3_10025 [Solirubrobacterales bacterium]
MERDARLYRTGCGAALIAGPALFFVDNLIHPEELTRGHESEQLAVIAADPARWQIAHLIGFASLLVFAAALLGLAYLVRGRMPRLGLAAGAAGVAGLMGLAFAFALDGFTWGALGEIYDDPGVDPATAELALHEVQESPWSLPYYALTALWAAAMVALAWGAARIGALPAASAALLAIATVAVGLEGVIQDNAYFIASSGLLLVAGTWAGSLILRNPDPWTRAGVVP